MKLKVSNYISEFLVKNGVTHVFTVTGGGAMHLNDALGHQKGLNSIYNHHEQACAMAAEGYTRYSGNIAAVCVTSGPGGTNAITGVLGGWLDSIPMFIISGQVKKETTIWSTEVPLRQLGDQEFNIVDAVSTMTKYSIMITEPNEIAYHLEKAFYLSQVGRGGPVWLDIPLDIQAAIIDTDKLIHFNKAECENKEIPPEVTMDTVNLMMDKINQAKRPVIIAGSGIRLGQAHEEFIQLIETLKIPVVTAWNAHDTLWNDHPLFCGKPGTVGTRGGNFIMENSDLILSLGCRLNIRQISYNYQDFAKNAYKIIVDIDEAELKKPTLSPDMPIHADAKNVIQSMLHSDTAVQSEKHKEWLAWCRNVDAKYPACLPEYFASKSPINPYVFVDSLFDQLEENDAIICGNGSACVITFQGAKIKKNQRLFTNSGCASMGYGFPAAIGVSVWRGKERVICIDGDGSFQMNLQELQTVVQYNLNIKIFIINNEGYHSIRQTQTNIFPSNPLIGVSMENGVSFPQCEKLANAYGIKYVKINNLDDINDSISNVLSTEGSVLCEVIVDKNQNFSPKLSSKVLPDGKIVSPPIDDMFPFLDKEEYDNNKIKE